MVFTPVTADGRVLRREHGGTEPIADGAELTRLPGTRLPVRLELSPLVRAVVDRDAPGDAGIYPGWMPHVAVREARALGRRVNAEVLRHSVREARATALRVPALRPDAAGDEHQTLDAQLVFDLPANQRGPRSRSTIPCV